MRYLNSDEKEVKIMLPRKLYEKIEELVSGGLFSSVEEFVTHGTRLLAELYGLTSESLIKKIVENVSGKVVEKPLFEDLSPLERQILNAFGKSKYLYIDEYYSIILREFVTQGQTPPKKEEFYEIVNKLVEKGYLEKIERNGEIMLKKKEE